MTKPVVALLVAMALAGCTNGTPDAGPAPTTSPPEPAPTTATASPVPVPSDWPTPPAGCAVTVPVPFEPPPGVDPNLLFGSDTTAGNGELWVGALGYHGVILGDADAEGGIGTKLGWWRHVDGELEITGRRLDGDAPPLTANVPSGYGPRGFQSSGVRFAGEGCWEVTGTVGSTSLTFVTYVVGR